MSADDPPYDGPTLRELVDRLRAEVRGACAIHAQTLAGANARGKISESHVLELLARLEVEIAAEIEARVDDVAMKQGYTPSGIHALPTAGMLATAVKGFLGGGQR